MNFDDDDSAAGTLRPLVGERIHLTDVGRYDLTGFRLSWDGDNYGRVYAVEPPEIPGAMRCCRWATCQAASYCASGKPHAPNKDADNGGLCYDHKPYVAGGIKTWGVLVANMLTVLGERQKGPTT